MARPCRFFGIAALMVSGLAVSAGAVEAAASPTYERVRRFSAAMSVADRAAALLAPHGLIERIEHREDGTVLFRAGPCYVPATLEEIPQDGAPMPGTPIDYRVSLGEVHCP